MLGWSESKVSRLLSDAMVQIESDTLRELKRRILAGPDLAGLPGFVPNPSDRIFMKSLQVGRPGASY